MKRILSILIAVTLLLGATGAWILYRSAHLVRQLDANYHLTEKGMSKAQVEELMGQNGEWRIDAKDPLGFWDDDRLPDSERAQIQSSVSYSEATFFLPVTFEFSFTEDGKLIARHRYD